LGVRKGSARQNFIKHAGINEIVKNAKIGGRRKKTLMASTFHAQRKEKDNCDGSRRDSLSKKGGALNEKKNELVNGGYLNMKKKPRLIKKRSEEARDSWGW